MCVRAVLVVRKEKTPAVKKEKGIYKLLQVSSSLQINLQRWMKRDRGCANTVTKWGKRVCDKFSLGDTDLQ